MICFEGALSVKAVLLAGNREVEEIWIDESKKDKDTSFILHRAQERNVQVVRCSRNQIEEKTVGKTHGGVICFAHERKRQSLEDCLTAEVPFLALIEGIEDPFNLGYALRTLYAAGCHGVLLQNRDWSKVESTIVKSSAGASEYLPIYFMEDTLKTLETVKKAGCVIYSAMRKEAIEYYDANFNQPILLAIGGEMRGLSKVVLENTNQNIYVPYASGFKNALNASSATAALSFEVVRQRRK